MKISAALLSLALAQDGDASQGAQSQGAQSQGAQSGYGEQGEQAESYGQESYEPQAASYAEAAPAYVKHAKPCLGSCEEEAPCLNTETGACSPYSCAQESYGAQAQGEYRRLGESDNSYGYEAPAAPAQTESYAAPAQSYAAPQIAYAAPSCDSCPEGTTDSACLRLTSGWPLWVGFVMLFLPAFWFVCSFWEILADQTFGVDPLTLGPNGTPTSVLPALVLQYNILAFKKVIASAILLIASMAYLTMASGHGYITRCCDGRSFYYARYIDWFFTTPLMLWEIACALDLSTFDWNMIFFMDLIMIVTGLIGSLICGGEKWIFWGFGMLAFIPIIWTLCAELTALKRAQEMFNNGTADIVTFDPFTAQNIVGDAPTLFTSTITGGATAAATLPIWLRQRIRNATNGLTLTVVSWFFYPIVWIFAEGAGSICSNAEAICYTVLDVIAKSFFAFVISDDHRSIYGTIGNNVIGANREVQGIMYVVAGAQPTTAGAFSATDTLFILNPGRLHFFGVL